MSDNPKSKFYIILSVVIVVAVVIAGIPVIKSVINKSTINGYFSSDINNVDNVCIISHCVKVDGKSNSVAGVKEAVRLGADAVIVDLCFNSDFIPVMTDNYDYISSAPEVEELFRELQAEKYKKIKIYLNIVQLSSMSKLNKIAVSYNMIDRLFLIGIDSQHYGMITSNDTIIPFLLDYKLSNDEIKALKDGTFEEPKCISDYGAYGIILNCDQINQETVESLNEYSVPFIVSGADSDIKFCKAMLDDVENIIVKDVKNSSVILNKWIEKMRERYRESVEHSLEEMSKNNV